MKGIYIHIPFCVRKCRYCDFVSYPNMEESFDRYLDAVFKEMEQYRGEKADTVFIGGGTPTALGAHQLDRLVKKCFEVFDIKSGYEFSIEANPGTIDDEKAKVLLADGVNRISVGVQSFDNSELKMLGRIHSAQTAYNTICRLNELGFLNINADIMTALPEQTSEKLMCTLNTALELPVTHISAYSLIIEDNTPMAEDYQKGKLVLPDEDSDRNMFAETVRLLEKNGFHRYEISNFAKDGFECRHNIKYWQCDEYIGLGAAAHSYDGKSRFFNTSDIKRYMSGDFGRHADALTLNDKISEFIFLGMRMKCGISAAEFQKRFNIDIKQRYGKLLDKFINGGFIAEKDGRYVFTDRGFDVSNSVLCEFVC